MEAEVENDWKDRQRDRMHKTETGKVEERKKEGKKLTKNTENKRGPESSGRQQGYDNSVHSNQSV